MHLFSNIVKFLRYLNITNNNANICYIGIANSDSKIEELFFKLCIMIFNRKWTVTTITEKNIDQVDNLMMYDFIFIGGGNTIKLVDVFIKTGFDKILFDAYVNSIKMGGVSAGILCFFKEGVTDSTGKLTIMKCLDFLPYSCTPHCSGSRKDFYLNNIANGTICDGYGIADGDIVHFVNEKIKNL